MPCRPVCIGGLFNDAVSSLDGRVRIEENPVKPVMTAGLSGPVYELATSVLETVVLTTRSGVV